MTRYVHSHHRRHSPQLPLFPSDAEMAPDVAHDLFPNNFRNQTAGSVIESDLLSSRRQLIITGFTSLTKIVSHLAVYHRRPDAYEAIHILIGHELQAADGIWTWRKAPAQEIADYWLEQHVSIVQCAELIAAIDVLEDGQRTGRIAVRTSDRQFIHAKIYRGDNAITTGSSNFSTQGMQRQIESNVRYEQSRFPEQGIALSAYADWVWEQGHDYLGDLLTLLRQMLTPVTWEEAVARACAELLEGAWARDYVLMDESPDTLPLWPTQQQGIAQALWIIENLGSVLIADATGSGKTLMGAHLMRAMVDHAWRTGRKRRVNPVLACPRSVESSWSRDYQGVCTVNIYTHGKLSSTRGETAQDVMQALRNADLFAVDEAHNFLDRTSQRTRTLYSNMADTVALFTATPINKGVQDLQGMVDLLGADNFDDATLKLLSDGLRRARRRNHPFSRDDESKLRRAIERFMVRRTMDMLNREIARQPDAYRDRYGKLCRYPDQEPTEYRCEEGENDQQIAQQIRQEADGLKGIVHLGRSITPMTDDLFEGSRRSVQDDLNLRLRMVHHLAIYHVVSCLRSSRAALLEHVYGTGEAIRRCGLATSAKSAANDGYVAKLDVLRCIGLLENHFMSVMLPSWLSDTESYQQVCDEEVVIYRRIAALAMQMSDARETSKVDLLRGLLAHHSKIVAFDWHVITLADLQQRLRVILGNQCDVYVATGGEAGDRDRVRALFDHDQLHTDQDRSAIALCSEAMAESIGLQRASAVVHLDVPSTIRRAEQRVGRIARMNSPHPRIAVFWPRETGAFVLNIDERLRERHATVRALIGANLRLPGDLEKEIETTAMLLQDGERNDLESWTTLSDAFAPVRALVAGEDGAKAPLVRRDVYRRLKAASAHVISAVSVVESDASWAFFAIAGTDWGGPRWAYLDDAMEEPLIDLEEVADRLRRRLEGSVENRHLDEGAAGQINHFITRLKKHESLLLPKKKQRALNQMSKVLTRYEKDAQASRDIERARLSHDLRSLMGHESGERAADLRALADCWLSAIQPVWVKRLADPRRTKPLRLRDIERQLIEGNGVIPTAVLRATFNGKRLLTTPLDRRIVAAIIGISTPAMA